VEITLMEPATLAILPGLDGGTRLSRPFVDRLPPTLAPLSLELPADIFLDRPRLLEWLGERLPRDRPFLLLAQSFTTPLAVDLARRHQVRGLILVTPLFRAPRWGLTLAARFTPAFLLRLHPPRFAVRRLLLGGDAPADLLDTFDASLRAVPGHVVAGRIRELGRWFADSVPLEPPCPTLCLHALEDRLLTGPIPQVSTDSVTHVALAGPHLLLPRYPAEVADQVIRFLAGTGG
jgi:hypothetical protein